MANSGTSAYGATLKFTSGGSTTTVGQITKVGWSGAGMTDIDISTMDGATKWREFIPGMKDPGEISADINYDGTSTTSGAGALLNIVGSTGTWTLQFADNATTLTNSSKFAVVGYLKPYSIDGPMDGAPITQSLTIKLSGLPTFTAKA